MLLKKCFGILCCSLVFIQVFSQVFYVSDGRGLHRHRLSDCSQEQICDDLQVDGALTFLPNGDLWDFDVGLTYARVDTNCNSLVDNFDSRLRPRIDAIVSDKFGKIWGLGNQIMKYDPFSGVLDIRNNFGIVANRFRPYLGTAVYHQRLEKIFHANRDGEIFETDTNDIRNSAFISQIDGLTDRNSPTAMVYKRFSCSEDQVYILLDSVGWHKLDLFTGDVELVCDGRVYENGFVGEFATLPWDIAPDACDLRLDLDVFNREADGQDGRRVLECREDYASGIDIFPDAANLEIFSESDLVDSMIIILGQAVDPIEYITYTSNGGMVQQVGPRILVSYPSQSTNLYHQFLASVQYINEACLVSAGVRRLEVSVFSGGMESAAVCAIDIRSQGINAGPDTLIEICRDEGRVFLPNMQDSCISQDGYWDPPLSNPCCFDTNMDTAGVYAYIVESPDCIADTAIYTFLVEDGALFLEDTVTMCDSIILDANQERGYQYQWSTGQEISSIWVYEGGIYYLQATTEGGCTFQDSIVVEEITSSPPVQSSIRVQPGQVITISPGYDPTTDLQFFVIEGDTLFDNVLSMSFSQRTMIEFCQSSEDINGCTDCITFEVTLESGDIFVPNVFSPNGDNLNDTWTLFSNSEIHLLTAEIYDRWGARVHKVDERFGQSIGLWDGRYQGGQRVNPGVYTYVLMYQEQGGRVETMSGELTIFY